MKSLFLFSLIGVLIIGYFLIPTASAQDTGGGVDHPGTWYVGEGLKTGDYFSYELCHVYYKDCVDFQMDWWIEGLITVGTEEKWLVQVVVYDGNKIVTGNMELGKIAPEPSGGSSELSTYRSAYKISIAWLSAYATKNIDVDQSGEKAFAAPSWGKIANIGGQQIKPTELETITVPAGTYDTIRIEWKTGGKISEVWVVDDFPYPVKASTWTQVPEGIPPQEYNFQLLDYKENVNSNPFTGITPTPVGGGVAEGCSQFYDLVDIKKTTKNHKYIIDLRYGPPDPASGCEIEWFISFKKPADETEFLNQVQYDIFVVDDKLTLPPIRSIAGEDGRNFLYSQGGQVHFSTIVKENAGTAHYVIWVYGLAPDFVVPPGEPDYLQIDIPIDGKVTPSPTCGPDQELVNGVCMDKRPGVPTCVSGTHLENGQCVPNTTGGGGCLIATAAFGSELAPQVQMLREIRDNTILSTTSGTAFMTGFNQFYYSFSPTIADWERENPLFQDAVRITITPLLASLSILNHVDIDSEEEMLGYGISLIVLNLGMYFVAPAIVILKLKKRF